MRTTDVVIPYERLDVVEYMQNSLEIMISYSVNSQYSIDNIV